MEYEWVFSVDRVDWEEVSELYRLAPLNDTPPGEFRVRFSNSEHACFVYDRGRLIAAGRAIADGNDCFYIADVAVHPDYQGKGVGTAVMRYLMGRSPGHQKMILYTVPGKEGFYHKLGFRRMTTAMALFEDQDWAAERGLIEED
jgi:ribosomal protein S18 acetylase RimI-like enzyme